MMRLAFAAARAIKDDSPAIKAFERASAELEKLAKDIF